jgi:hypothetical protein
LDTALIQHSNSIEHSIEHSSAPIDKQRNQETKKPRNNRVVFTPPSENDIYNFMGELNMKSGGKWSEMKIVAESKNCFDHYTSTGWKTSGGAKIVSWESTVRKWMNNAFKFDQNKKPNQNEREKRNNDLEQFRKQYRSSLASSFGIQDIPSTE